MLHISRRVAYKRRGATRRGFLFIRKQRERVVTYALPPLGRRLTYLPFDISNQSKFLKKKILKTYFLEICRTNFSFFPTLENPR